MRQRKKLNFGGFSLVEVLVTVGILSILATGLATILANMVKANKTQQFGMDLNNAQQEVRTLLQDPASCAVSFSQTAAGQPTILKNPLSSQTYNQLSNPGKTQIFMVNQPFDFQGYSLSITSITLTKYYDTVAPRYGIAQVSINYASSSPVYGGNNFTKIITLETTKNPANNNLTACVAVTGMGDAQWNYVTASNWNIAYSQGLVGIGNPAPSFILDVDEGSVQDGGLRIAGDGTSSGKGDMGIRLNNTGAGGTEWYLDSTNGGSGYGPEGLAFVSGIGNSPNMLLRNFSWAKGYGTLTVNAMPAVAAMYPTLQVNSSPNSQLSFQDESLGGPGGGVAVLRSISAIDGVATVAVSNKNDEYQFRVDPSIKDGLVIFDAKKVANRIVVAANTGDVGIGLDTGVVPTHLLQLALDDAFKPATGTWNYHSDARLKDIGKPFERSLEAIDGIHPIYYHYKKDNPLGLPSGQEYVGVVAQEIQKQVPEAVKSDSKGFLYISGESVYWAMLNAIKELYHRWQDDSAGLHADLASLQTERQAGQSEIDQLRAENQAKDQQIQDLQRRLEVVEKILQK